MAKVGDGQPVISRAVDARPHGFTKSGKETSKLRVSTSARNSLLSFGQPVERQRQPIPHFARQGRWPSAALRKLTNIEALAARARRSAQGRPVAFGGRAAATTALNLRSIMFSSRSAYGKGLNPNSVKKVLCFSLAIEMAFSISTNSRCVAAKSISASPTAVLM